MKILGIETSADDTGVALMEGARDFGTDFVCKILGNAVRSQTVHAEYGGIYPNLAKREHVKNLPVLLERVLKETDATMEQSRIDCIAVTVGPGLEPCLWTGINFAQALSLVWNVPIVAVNHMEGHILSALLKQENGKKYSISNVQFPAIALLISGGHTELILMREWMRYKYLGRTRDDAVGEAFDKVARMLGLPYPGGPHISRLAEKARQTGLVKNISLPRPMLRENNLDFSFAGLKTAVLRLIESKGPTLGNSLRSDLEFKQEVAREFEDAAADVLVEKTLRAIEQHGANVVAVGGGVSANKHIRAELATGLQDAGCKLLLSPPEFTTDNAVMIALAGYLHALKKEFAEPKTLVANGNLKLEMLSDSVLK